MTKDNASKSQVQGYERMAGNIKCSCEGCPAHCCAGPKNCMPVAKPSTK